jgi:ornithine--oxo-acid transaminase
MLIRQFANRAIGLKNSFSLFPRRKIASSYHRIYTGDSTATKISNFKPIKTLKDSLGIAADPTYYMNLEAKFGAVNYKPLPVVIERARDCHVWDVNNRRYLDFTASYATVSQGHCHPKIKAAAIAQMEKVTLTSRVFYNTYLAEYQQRMCETLGFERYFMANGGCEAAESSWKMARAWGYIHKKIPRNEAIIVFPENNFTGRSIAAASASTDPSCYNNYGPYVPNFINVQYDNPAALERLFQRHSNIAAYYLEPIQGEAGIILPSAGYLRTVRDLCTKYNVLMIADEIQVGLGRTGFLRACDVEDVKPDLMVLGKALGGGFIPVSAVGGRADVILSLQTGTHGSTFCSNPMSCAISDAAVQVIIENDLISNSRKQGDYLQILLTQIKNKYQHTDFVKEVRGRGLAIGVEIYSQKYNIDRLVNIILENGMLIKSSHGKTLRISPPLTITPSLIEEGADIIDRSIQQYLDRS